MLIQTFIANQSVDTFSKYVLSRLIMLDKSELRTMPKAR